MFHRAKALSRRALGVSIICGFAACARSSGEIAPAPVPPSAFEPATCRQLSLMHAKAMRSLVYAELMQDQRYAEDRTRTFGVPTPFATLFEENREAEVALLKGETLALAAQLEQARCMARGG